MRKTFLLIFFLFLASLYYASCNAGSGNNSYIAASPVAPVTNEIPQILPNTKCNLSEHKLDIMLARSFNERAKGLMYYESLEPKKGMLFVYSSPRMMSFWMLNTKIPLDLIFFDQSLQITEWIENMEPGYGEPIDSLPRYTSTIPAQYALELKAGSVKELKLKVGDRLDIPVTLLYSE